MAERSDSETQSHREEQGKSAPPDVRALMADVPLAPSSAGVLGGAGSVEDSTTDADRRQAAERERIERREIL